MNRHLTQFVTLACTLLVSGTALAHSGNHQAGSFFSGLMHPLLGVDHMLALVAIGLYSTSSPACRTGLPALVFLGTMVVGAALAMHGIVLPGIEAGIAVSVLVAGLLLMRIARLNSLNSTALIALFALFHGQAHGLEMPASAVSLLYGLGLVVSSGCLLLSATRLGLWLRESRTKWSLHGAGLLSSVAGVWLLFGV